MQYKGDPPCVADLSFFLSVEPIPSTFHPHFYSPLSATPSTPPPTNPPSLKNLNDSHTFWLQPSIAMSFNSNSKSHKLYLHHYVPFLHHLKVPWLLELVP